jgi:CRP/FNR family transcriptional activator FtrB
MTMQTDEIAQLRALPLFKDLADDNFGEIVRGIVPKRSPAYATLVDEGERSTVLHIVMEGAVELFSRLGRRETSIGVVQPVAPFFLASAVCDLPCPASARTIEPSLILTVPAESIRAVFERDGGFARAIVFDLSRSFRQMTADLKAQRLRTSVERLASWIVVHEALNGSKGQFTLPYDKRTLAARLGMSPENLSRNFAFLSDHGVTVRRRDVAIADPAKLADFAKSKPPVDNNDD